MDTILVLAHTETDGSVARAALETAGAAAGIAGSLGTLWSAGLVGSTVEPGAAQLAGCGASRVLAVSGEAFGVSRYATDAVAAEAICRVAGATLVFAPATSRWARTLAGVAHRLGGRADTHVTAVSAGGEGVGVTRWFYRQRIEATARRTHRPWIVLIEPGTHPVVQAAPRPAFIEQVPVEASGPMTRTTFMGYEAPAADRQTIRPDARLLFVAGAGWTKKQSDGQPHLAEAEQLILGFLRASQASLGGSKSLVDLSGEGQAVLPFMSHLNQVGQTGSTPRHPKGLATCCHGEEPHVVGWRFINERRAINLDPNCGWARGKADVLYVADAFEVVAKVIASLAAEAT